MTVGVTAPPAAPTLQLSANQTVFRTGESPVLTWTSTNANSCTAGDGWTGSKSANGSETLSPISMTTTYSLSCVGTGGSISRSVTVSFAPQPSVAMSAEPNSVTTNQASTLTWTSQYATSCSAGGEWLGAKSLNGSASTGSLSAGSHTFSLTCTGPGGTATASAEVTAVDPPPPPPPPPPTGQNYSTQFDSTEFPISESGAWHRADNAFTDVRTAGGVASGTNGPANDYDDSYALLSGFGPDQTAEAVIQVSSSLNTSVIHEVELLLRFADDENGARGYECLFAQHGLIQLVRWNGVKGDFTVIPLSGASHLGREFDTGDTIKATIVGDVISLYVNNNLIGTASDSTYSSGQPGISFFTRPGGDSANFGLTSYTVSSP